MRTLRWAGSPGVSGGSSVITGPYKGGGRQDLESGRGREDGSKSRVDGTLTENRRPGPRAKTCRQPLGAGKGPYGVQRELSLVTSLILASGGL